MLTGCEPGSRVRPPAGVWWAEPLDAITWLCESDEAFPRSEGLDEVQAPAEPTEAVAIIVAISRTRQPFTRAPPVTDMTVINEAILHHLGRCYCDPSAAGAAQLIGPWAAEQLSVRAGAPERQIS